MTIWLNEKDNSLHDDMDGEALSLPSWPQGMVEATDEQIAAAAKPSIDRLSADVRAKRDNLLSTIYDKGVLIVQRTIRLNGDADGKLSAKLHELDEYADALLNVPEQAGFPHDITWPTVPSETL